MTWKAKKPFGWATFWQNAHYSGPERIAKTHFSIYFFLMLRKAQVTTFDHQMAN